jgi:hypothetical protein
MLYAVEEQVVRDMESRLARITPDNGYATDAGLRVLAYDPEPGAEPIGPWVQIGDIQMERTGIAGGWQIGVDVGGFVNTSGDTWRADAFALLEDMTRALQDFTPDLVCVPQASRPRVNDKRMERREAGSNYIMVGVTATVVYQEIQ